MTLTLIDPVCSENIHVPFNSAFIESVKYFNSTEINYFGDDSNVRNIIKFRENVVPNIVESTLTFSAIEIPVEGKFLEIRQSVNLFFLLRRISRKYKSDLIFVTTCPSLGIFAIYLYRLLTWNGQPVYPILHRASTQLQSQRFVVRTITRWLFSLPLNKMKIFPIVLSRLIKENIEHILGEKAKKFIAIDHPYIFPELRTEQTKFNFEDNLKLGFLGLGNKARGFDLFIELAIRLASINPQIEFYGIGALGDDLKGYDQRILRRQMKDFQIPRDEYERNVKETDIAFFSLSGKNYSYIMSGALLDALVFRKPIIFMRSLHVEKLLVEFGEIGLIVNDFDHMVQVLQSIFDRDKTIILRLNKILLNQLKIIDRFQPMTVGSNLRKLM
jgi:hypothetical protein